MARWGVAVSIATWLASSGSVLADESLRGSSASLDRQNRVAREHDFSYLDTPRQVRRFAAKGWLVRIRRSENLRLRGVSFPYARPEVKTFLERLSAQYRSACGERLVVTSLTRPTSRQPRNASDRSVHPTGMAIDLRRSRLRACQRWIERVLLDLEGNGVLEATRERRPVHYHVALFPRQYTAYVAALDERDEPTPPSAPGDTYAVRRGDSLWTIARSHGTTVAALRSVNGLRTNRLRAGDTLVIPGAPAPDPTPAATVAAAEAGETETAQPTPAVSSERAPPATSEASMAPVAAPAPATALALADPSPPAPATAMATAAVPEASESEAAGGQYTVRRGDSLWTIARAAGTTVREIRQANGLRSNLVRAGQALYVPGDVAGLDRRSYTVRSGDTLWIIAREHGTTVREIRRANGLRNSRIYVGQVLELPSDG